jgi:oligopeptide/dipeptide ABC transporter ATP-binding protein
MYAGRIVELQSVRGLFYHPRHPYTRALLDSIPKLGTKEPLYAIPGQPPDLSAPPPGCAFHPRCPQAMDRCRSEAPPEFSVAGNGTVATCWLLAAETARG